MNKRVLCFLTILSVTFLSAQVEIKPGVKAGLNFSNLTNLEKEAFVSNTNSVTSFHIGGTVSFKFADFYTLQPEILYSKQGSEIEVHGFDNNNTENVDVELTYLSIPVNNKFFIGDSGFHFEAAPIIDILISHENIDDPQTLDIALAVGLGFELPVGVSVSLRYKQGIVDVFGRNVDTGNGAQTTSFSDLVLNKVVQLSVGYKFDLNR